MNKSKKEKRHFNQFTLNERIRIEIRYRDGWSLGKIVKELGNGRTTSSISRETAGKPRKGIGKYQAHIAHEQALNRRKGKKTFRLKNDQLLNYFSPFAMRLMSL